MPRLHSGETQRMLAVSSHRSEGERSGFHATHTLQSLPAHLSRAWKSGYLSLPTSDLSRDQSVIAAPNHTDCSVCAQCQTWYGMGPPRFLPAPASSRPWLLRVFSIETSTEDGEPPVDEDRGPSVSEFALLMSRVTPEIGAANNDSPTFVTFSPFLRHPCPRVPGCLLTGRQTTMRRGGKGRSGRMTGFSLAHAGGRSGICGSRMD